MKSSTYCLFETALGCCGIAWKESGDPGILPAISFFQLPEAAPEITENRIAQYCGAHQASQPPPEISRVIGKVCRHFEGELQDFRDVALDLAGTGSFAQQVYAATRAVPAGQTRTYGEIAEVLNRASAARAVGQALGRNPIALIIPCHRVLAAGGKSGGFTAHGGVGMKVRMLAIEGVIIGK